MEALALAGASSGAGCNRLLESDDGINNSSQTETPIENSEYRAKDSLVEEVIEFLEKYDSFDSVSTQEMKNHVINFSNDDRLPRLFINSQLENWRDLPKHEAVSTDAPKFFVLSNERLYSDDWLASGKQHINPDGSDGPGHHRDHRKEPGFVGIDAFQDRWTNNSFQVFDVINSGIGPEEWKYLGFQSEQGDRAGRRGENKEYIDKEEPEGSIAKYLEGKKIGDLTDTPLAVCMNYWLETDSSDKNTKVGNDTIEMLEQFFGSKGINFHMIEGESFERKDEANRYGYRGEEVPKIVDDIPEDLKGVVECAISVDDLEGKAGQAIATDETYVGVFENASWLNSTELASLLFHEVYGHNFVTVRHAPEQCDSLMVQGDLVLELTDDEWKEAKRQLSIYSRKRYGQGYNGMRPVEEVFREPNFLYSSGDEYEC